MLTVTYGTSCFRVGATLGYEYNICWNEFINWRSFLSRHSFHVKRKGWTESKLAERTRERERKRDGALLQKGCGVGNKLGQVIYKRQRKDNPGPYQDDNKAYPKDFWWSMFLLVLHLFIPPANYQYYEKHLLLGLNRIYYWIYKCTSCHHYTNLIKNSLIKTRNLFTKRGRD